MRSGTGKIIVSSPLIEISALGWQHDLCPAHISPKSWFVSREIFIFEILERVHSLTEAILGENIGFSRRTAESATFNMGVYGMMQASTGHHMEPPSQTGYLGLIPSDFEIRKSS